MRSECHSFVLLVAVGVAGLAGCLKSPSGTKETGDSAASSDTDTDTDTDAVVHFAGEYRAVDADVIINGATGDALGRGFAAGADLDGDGVLDLVVAAPTLEGDITGGKTYIFSPAPAPGTWSASVDAQTTLISDGGARLSTSPTPIDFNIDGDSDLLLDGQRADSPSGVVDAGAVYFVPGGRSLGSGPEDIGSAQTRTWFGASSSAYCCFLANGGDFNGDAHDDLVGGAVYAQTDGYLVGAAYVVTSGTSSTSDEPIGDVASSTWFGDQSVPGAGGERAGTAVDGCDLDADGLSDLVVGAAEAFWDGDGSLGHVYIVSDESLALAGDENALADADVVFTGEIPDGGLGGSFACLSDPAGGESLAIGEGDGGHVYLIRGSSAFFSDTPNQSTPTEVATATFAASGGEQGFGKAVAAGDVDGDGRPDLLIGAPDNDSNVTEGTAWLFNDVLSSTGTVYTGSAIASFAGTQAGDHFGIYAGIADVDGDGDQDILLAADAADSDAGQLTVFLNP